MKKIIALLVVVMVLGVGCLKQPEPMQKADLEMEIEEQMEKEMAEETEETSIGPEQEEAVEEFVEEEVDGVEDLGEDLDTQDLEDIETLDEIFEDY